MVHVHKLGQQPLVKPSTSHAYGLCSNCKKGPIGEDNSCGMAIPKRIAPKLSWAAVCREEVGALSFQPNRTVRIMQPLRWPPAVKRAYCGLLLGPEHGDFSSLGCQGLCCHLRNRHVDVRYTTAVSILLVALYKEGDIGQVIVSGNYMMQVGMAFSPNVWKVNLLAKNIFSWRAS